jgi:hypothetical protein
LTHYYIFVSETINKTSSVDIVRISRRRKLIRGGDPKISRKSREFKANLLRRAEFKHEKLISMALAYTFGQDCHKSMHILKYW